MICEIITLGSRAVSDILLASFLLLLLQEPLIECKINKRISEI